MPRCVSVRMTRKPALLFFAAALLGASHASAHDTWFQRLDAEGPAPLLALGTGNQFPAQESGIDARFIAASGCRAARVATTLQAVQQDEHALRLRAAPAASTCWLQTTPFTVTLEPAKIALYLREVNPNAEQRAQWADMQRRGLPWRERYVKHARIELGDEPGAAPAPLGLDLVIEHTGPIGAGATFAVRVLRDGQPLANQAVELRSEDSPFGIWRRSDAQGRLQMPSPAAGRWLLRTIDLRLSATEPDTWDSRFATTAFQIVGPQIGMNLTSNARSANQAAATAAISSEPPSNTARR